jgi:TolA-binding protein
MQETVEALRREILETRNAVIRADNQVRALEAQVKRIGGEESGRGKRLVRAVIAAYLLAAGLTAAGLWTAFDARSRALGSEMDGLRSAAALERSRYDKLAGEVDATRAAARRAAEIWMLVRTNKRHEAIEAFAAADMTGFTETEREVLQAAVDRFRVELSARSFETGKAFYDDKDMKKAEAEFKASLETKDDAPHSAEAWYWLALVHYQLGRFRECADELRHSLESHLDVALEDDARYYFGSALEAIPDYARAREQYKIVATKFGMSVWAPMARAKLFKLKGK